MNCWTFNSQLGVPSSEASRLCIFDWWQDHVLGATASQANEAVLFKQLQDLSSWQHTFPFRLNHQHGRRTIPSRFMSPTWWAKTFGRKEPSTVGSCPSSLHHTLFSVSHPPSGPNQVASGLKTPPIFEELTDSQRFSEGGSVQHDEFQLHPFRWCGQPGLREPWESEESVL